MEKITSEDSKSLINNETLDKRVKDLEVSFERKIEDSKRDLVTILGVFVSFITFTSIEFQILESINNFSDYIALSFLLMSAMLLFVFALKNLIREDEDKFFYKKPLFVLIVILLIISFSTYLIPRVYKEIKNNKQQVKQQV